MKIKCIPSDFFVTEKVCLEPGDSGTFYAFILEKEGLTTGEALNVLSRAAGVRRSAWRNAGLKDKHAHTRQYVTIPAGEWRRGEPKCGVAASTKKARLHFSGRSAEAVRRGHITSNEFRVVIRDLTRAKIDLMQGEWEMLCATGMPNYFDTQRFGAARHGRGLVLAELLRGDGAGAMRLLLTSISRKDHRVVKERRRIADKLWGKWAQLAQKLPDSPEKAAVEKLASDGTDFEGALAEYEKAGRIPYNVLAFQSMIYNLMVSRAVEDSGVPFFRVEIGGAKPAYAALKPESLSPDEPLPLVCPGKSVAQSWQEAFEGACKKMDIDSGAIEMSGLPRKMWDRSARRTWAEISETAKPRVVKDEIYPRRRALILSFELPPASYATLAIKRLQHAAG